ncbi:deoxyribonuclease V [Deinococcus arcticus]|uniref:Endonuclease V n=1 Tax=Deinococcus arcticus TaxID=2136176 RepID=A0A2T3WBJ5_9DEIO|nr:deoxyribonuclease V [Deinococcus arcticus]
MRPDQPLTRSSLDPATLLEVPASAQAAEALQRRWAGQVLASDDLGPVTTVAGVDVAYHESSGELVAAAVLLDAPSLTVLEEVTLRDHARFPYVPGLFSFRECPPVARAVQGLSRRPDLIVCDGHGVAHPRRFGLACHLGLALNIPTIGCGKTRLTGEDTVPGLPRGEWTPLLDGPEVLGAALRTQSGVRPVYVSVGHRVSLPTALAWVLRLSPRYRLPETTRAADRLVRRALAEVSHA